MSDEVIEYVVAHAGQSRRDFLVKLLAGSAFAVPVVASFAIGGSATPKRSPLDAGSNIDCGPNATWDDASNMCVDNASNTPDDDVDSGGGALPATK